MVFVKESTKDNCVPKDTKHETKEELELSNFLNEFQDVFTDDIPEELPPKRGEDDYYIKLIPSSLPLNKRPY